MSSKRFFDREIWQKEWFQDLSQSEKLAWFYLTSVCDPVGVWKPNYKLAEYQIGRKVDWHAFAGRCNNNIAILPNGRWWLVDFCRFQHPDLNPESSSRPIVAYIRMLKEHGLWDEENQRPVDKGLIGSDLPLPATTPVPRNRKRKPDLVLGEYKNVRLTTEERQKLHTEYGEADTEAAIEFISNWKEEKGKVVKNDYLAIRRWTIGAVRERGNGKDIGVTIASRMVAEGVWDDKD